MSCATKSSQTRFAISDRSDICWMLKLSWLHLPSDSAPVGEVRRLVTDKVLISKSAHSLDEAIAAEEAGCNMLIVGSIFPTKSHTGEPLGLDVGGSAKSARYRCPHRWRHHQECESTMPELPAA
jgi:thiamine-phosphate pyrophosphorylase